MTADGFPRAMSAPQERLISANCLCLSRRSIRTRCASSKSGAILIAESQAARASAFAMLKCEQPSPFGVVAREIGVGRLFELDALFEVTQGTRPLCGSRILASKLDVGSSAVKGRHVRLECDRPAELIEGLIGLALLQVDLRKCEKRFQPARIEPDRGVQVGLRGPNSARSSLSTPWFTSNG